MRALVARLGVWDQWLVLSLSRQVSTPWLDRVMGILTHAGGAGVTTAACLVLLLVPGTRTLGIVASLSNLVSHLLVQLLKRTLVRRRPSVAIPGCAALIVLPDPCSFPSGHACAAMAVAVSVVLQHPGTGLPLVAIALAVGFTRVYLRVHYVTDVLVGQGLGAGTALLLSASLS